MPAVGYCWGFAGALFQHGDRGESCLQHTQEGTTSGGDLIGDMNLSIAARGIAAAGQGKRRAVGDGPRNHSVPVANWSNSNTPTRAIPQNRAGLLQDAAISAARPGRYPGSYPLPPHPDLRLAAAVSASSVPGHDIDGQGNMVFRIRGAASG